MTTLTQVMSASDDPLWAAQPGGWYRINHIEWVWVLLVREGGPFERLMWIQVDDRVQLSPRYAG